MAGEGSPGAAADRPQDNGGQPDQAPPEAPPSPPPAPQAPPEAPPERAEPRPADRPDQDGKTADRGDDRPSGWSHREPGASKDTDHDRGGSPLSPRPEPDRTTGERDQAAERDNQARRDSDAAGKERADKAGDETDRLAAKVADAARAAADRTAAERDRDSRDEIARAKAPGGWSPDRGRPAFAKPPEGDKGGKADGSGDKGDKGDGGKDKGDKPGRVRELKDRIDRVGGPHKFAGRVMKETVKHAGERAKDIPKDAGRTAVRKTVEGGRAAKEKTKDLGRAAVKKTVEGAKNHVRKSIATIPEGKTYDQDARDKIHEAYKQQRQANIERRADRREFKRGERAAYKELKRDGTRSKRQIRNDKPGPRHPRLHPIRHNRWKRGDGKTIKMMHHRHGIPFQDQRNHGTPHPADQAKREAGPKPRPGYHPPLTRRQWRAHPHHPRNKGK